MADIEFSKLNILMIDDESFMRGLIRRVLRDMGVKNIREAADGQRALDILNANEERIDLIICDLQMPNMDGFQFVYFLRRDETKYFADVPVLILTGHAEQESVDMARKLGINGYVVKPVSRDTLEARMKVALTSPRL